MELKGLIGLLKLLQIGSTFNFARLKDDSFTIFHKKTSFYILCIYGLDR